MSSGVEQWGGELLSSLHSTLHHLITAPPSSPTYSLEDSAHSQVAQVTTMGLYLQWCRECEQALLQCRYDRRALPGARGKFNTWSVNRIVTLLMKNMWKVVADEVLTPLQRTRLEALAMVRMYKMVIVITLHDFLHRLIHNLFN